MIFRVFRNPRFYVLFVFLTIVWFMIAEKVIAFSLLSAWTKDVNIKMGNSYVKESVVDDTIIGTTLANISLGEGEYKSDATTKKNLKLVEMSEMLVEVDIMELLKNAEDPEIVMRTHLKHIEKTLQEIEDTVKNLHEQAIFHAKKSEECLVEKKRGDQLFFKGVQDSDEASMAEGLALSLESSPCYITERVKANAAMYQGAKVGINFGLLSKRQKLLFTKGDLLVNNMEYMEGTLLEELLLLKHEMQQLKINIKNIDYSGEIAGSFINIFDPEREIKKLPNFSVFFPSGKGNPTYQKPFNRER